MKIKEIVKRDVVTCDHDATLQEAGQLMAKAGIGLLPLAEDNRLVGAITDRDITVRGTAKGLDPQSTPISSVMTPELVYCFEEQDVKDAARLMEDQQLRRLLVVDRNRHFVGIIS